MSAAQWREDLRFMAAEMERRHKNLYHTVTREQFAAAIADLDARIPKLQRHEIIVGMMRIAAMVGDGHTRVDPRKDTKFQFPSLPLKLYLFEDGVFVRAAAPQYAALVGAKIEAVGGIPIEEAIGRVSEISSRDNEIGPKLFVPLYLNMPDILHALKMSPQRDAAVLRLSKGNRTWTATIPAGAVEPVWPPDTDVSLVTPDAWVDARRTPEPPLWLQAPLDYHRMIELPERRALYTQLNMVTHIKGQSLGDFGMKIRKKAEETNPRAVIVDLRLNHGGNHGLRHRYLRELVKLEDADTRLFVLTWRGTFSASEALLVDLDDLTDAVFIGEPASSKPNSYGDAYRMPLPHSGISVRSSIYWNQLGGHLNPPWTPVNVATPFTFADYAAGRDPALEAALNYTPSPSLKDQLLEAAKTGGVRGVLQALERYRSDVANRYQDLAQMVAQAAESLQAAKFPEEALAVAQVGVQQFPQNVDGFLVLAHLAEAAKRTDLALSAAKSALELDPNNRLARSLVDRIASVPGPHRL
jgi:hypothetical protein